MTQGQRRAWMRQWARDQQLSRSEKAILLLLENRADRNGVCWPSQDTLAREAAMSVRTVRRQLQALRSRGLIERRIRYRSDGGRLTDEYLLRAPGASWHTGHDRPEDKTAIPEEPSAAYRPTSTTQAGNAHQAMPDKPSVPYRPPLAGEEQQQGEAQEEKREESPRALPPPWSRTRELQGGGEPASTNPNFEDHSKTVRHVEQILRTAPSLKISTKGIEQALLSCPNQDPIEAARDVVTWESGGELNNTNAGWLLKRALQKQREAHTSPSQPGTRRHKPDLSRFEQYDQNVSYVTRRTEQ